MSLRSKLAYAVAVVLLVPFTGWLEFWYVRDDVLEQYRDPIVVTAGKTAEYAGARWKLTETVVRRKGVTYDPLPRNAVGYYAILSVTPPDAAAAKRIQGCGFGFEAVDAAGRSWEPATDADYEVVGNPDTSCSYGENADPIPAGRTQRIAAAFIVPKDAVASLRIQVKLAKTDPRYLEFVPTGNK